MAFFRSRRRLVAGELSSARNRRGGIHAGTALEQGVLAVAPRFGALGSGGVGLRSSRGGLLLLLDTFGWHVALAHLQPLVAETHSHRAVQPYLDTQCAAAHARLNAPAGDLIYLAIVAERVIGSDLSRLDVTQHRGQ